ncbi:MAG: hypothetical protein A2020_08595 [Lentisphaerae bacterium GWF2_45_14]|nr:MAG: hypothetical protein A2020_08595 [Lentisphaerae bacterium GWF2_45_14]
MGFLSGKRLFKRNVIFPLIVVAIVFSLWFYENHLRLEDPSIYRSYPVMGTFSEVVLYGDKTRAEKAADLVYEEFARVENTCSIFKQDSELSRLNASAFEKPFECSKLLWDILSASRDAWKLSGGAFDITAKPLMDIWGFYRKRNELPSPEDVKKALSKVGLEKVIFDDNAKTVRFTVKGMSFDLGGIAKGFAVDLATKSAELVGIKTGIINLGGNIRCLPVPPKGRGAFGIGIRNPLDKNEICGKISLVGASTATSGNYERYVEIGGKQYTHIMDVRTGLPVSGMLSVTIVTPLALYADILSTSIFIKGPEFGKEVARRIPGTSVLVIWRSSTTSETEVVKIGPAFDDFTWQFNAVNN